MCGRFTRNYTWSEIHRYYSLISTPANIQPNFNVCPTQTIDAVIEQGGKRVLAPMRWGLVPAWWSKPLKELRLATFNARAETASEKPFFRGAWKRSRCLIPASGYYEWQDVAPKKKQPWYFTRRDNRTMTMAGLWDEWTDRESGKALRSCTMLITEPNQFVSEVHDRMPVILEERDFEPWLSGKAGLELMTPAAEGVLTKWPVSPRVNSSRTPGDDPTLIELYDPALGMTTDEISKAIGNN